MQTLKKKRFFILLTICSFSFFVFNINAANASSNELVTVDILVNVLEIDPKANLATIVIGASILNFPYNYTNLDVYVRGGNSVYVTCNNTGSNGINVWRYQGFSKQTSWLLGGTGENFPFNSYSLNFEVDSVSGIGKNFTLDSVGAILEGPNYLDMKNTWKTENVTLLPITQITSYKVVFNLEKTKNAFIADVTYFLVPIIACYYLLGATLIFNPRTNLRGRLTIYLSLFVFSSSFLFTLQSSLPFHSSLTFPEFLLSNLTVSTVIFGISSIIGSKPKEPWEFTEEMGFHVKWDSYGLILALFTFSVFYLVTLFGKLSITNALVFTYIITPSYVYAYFFNAPKKKLREHKLRWILFLILALFPLELLLFIRMIFLLG